MIKKILLVTALLSCICLVGCKSTVDKDGKYKTMEGYVTEKMQDISEQDLIVAMKDDFEKSETVLDKNTINLNYYLSEENDFNAEKMSRLVGSVVIYYIGEIDGNEISDSALEDFLLNIYVYEANGEVKYYLNFTPPMSKEEIKNQLKKQDSEFSELWGPQGTFVYN